MRRSLDVLLSEDGDNARIGCARRVMDGGDGKVESLPAARPYLESGRVVLIDIGKPEMSLSSSGLRTRCRSGDQSWSTATTTEICQYIVDHKLYRSIRPM
jgi:nicotinic acid mononucleotide adenylyltransferase